MLLTETCYYTENQGFGGATNRDMSLNETCLYSRLYGMLKGNIFIDKLECLTILKKISIDHIKNDYLDGLGIVVKTSKTLLLFHHQWSKQSCSSWSWLGNFEWGGLLADQKFLGIKLGRQWLH